MARQRARVVLHGRFSPGTVVRLVAVRDERVLRPGAGDREVDHKIVDADGRVEFSTGIVVGGRYFVCGIQQGVPLEVRATGRLDADPVNDIPPNQTEPRRFANGGGDVDPAPADAVAAAEEQERVRRAGPAGSEGEAAERVAIRREKREAQAAGDGSDPRDDNQGENDEGAV